MAKLIVRGKKEEFLTYALRKINQLRLELDNEAKGFPEMRAKIKHGVMQRVANWCVVFAFLAAYPVMATPDTLNHEPYGQQLMEIVDQVSQPEQQEQEFPWHQLGLAVVAIFELVVRLKPTGKDWSILSRIAGIIEFMIPNRASPNAVHLERMKEAAKPPPGKEKQERGKWIGGKLWYRVKEVWDRRDPEDRYTVQD